MLISFWFTCLLVARAMSIVLMNSCNPFALLDLAFMRTHRATKALMPSSATSSLPSDWFLSAAASRLKRESKLGASVLTSESTVSSENFSNPSKLSGPWTKTGLEVSLSTSCSSVDGCTESSHSKLFRCWFSCSSWWTLANSLAFSSWSGCVIACDRFGGLTSELCEEGLRALLLLRRLTPMAKVLRSVTTAGNACRSILEMSTLVRSGNLSFMTCSTSENFIHACPVWTCFGNVHLLLKKHCEIDCNITKSCPFSVDNGELMNATKDWGSLMAFINACWVICNLY